MDLGEPFPARAQLLHAAARAGGAAARDLYRLADAPHARRHHGRRPLRHPRHHLHHGVELRLRRLRQRAGHRRAVLRPQGGGAGDRAGGGVPHRQARAQEQRDGVHRGGGVRGNFLLQRSVSDHHLRRGTDRFSRRSGRLYGISGRRRSRRQQARRRRRRQPARRRASRARASHRCTGAAGVGGVAGALAGAGDRASRHAGKHATCSARSPCSSARWRW